MESNFVSRNRIDIELCWPGDSLRGLAFYFILEYDDLDGSRFYWAVRFQQVKIWVFSYQVTQAGTCEKLCDLAVNLSLCLYVNISVFFLSLSFQFLIVRGFDNGIKLLNEQRAKRNSWIFPLLNWDHLVWYVVSSKLSFPERSFFIIKWFYSDLIRKHYTAKLYSMIS